MTYLYTKNGRPLEQSGDRLFSRSGQYLGRISNGRVYNPAGQYAGTIVGDRIVYRAIDCATLSGPSVSINHVGVARINAVPAAILGDEPPFPD